MAVTWADLVSDNFTATGILTDAAPVVGAFAVLVIALVIAPRYGMKVLRWIRRAVG